MVFAGASVPSAHSNPRGDDGVLIRSFNCGYQYLKNIDILKLGGLLNYKQNILFEGLINKTNPF